MCYILAHAWYTMVTHQRFIGHLFGGSQCTRQYFNFRFRFWPSRYLHVSLCAWAVLCGDSAQYLLFCYDDLRCLCLEETLTNWFLFADPNTPIAWQIFATLVAVCDSFFCACRMVLAGIYGWSSAVFGCIHYCPCFGGSDSHDFSLPWTMVYLDDGWCLSFGDVA